MKLLNLLQNWAQEKKTVTLLLDIDPSIPAQLKTLSSYPALHFVVHNFTDLQLSDLLLAEAKTDRSDNLFATVVCDQIGTALGLVYSSAESVRASISERRGIYWSRSRQSLWRKGETSGAAQHLLNIALDCDSDAFRFVVVQEGMGFCHLSRLSCWSEATGMQHLFCTLNQRLKTSEKGSYTARLFSDAGLLNNKIIEEANELIDAERADHIASEAADLIYFMCVHMVKNGVHWTDVLNILDRRSMKVRRRAGNAKPSSVTSDKLKPTTHATVDANGQIQIEQVTE